MVGSLKYTVNQSVAIVVGVVGMLVPCEPNPGVQALAIMIMIKREKVILTNWGTGYNKAEKSFCKVIIA
jgi:hypothetical protein